MKNVNILGVVTFVNLLKEDTKATLELVRECQISAKIITGDNIFLAVKTAIMSGILPQDAVIEVVQGEKYNADTG